MSKKKKKFIFEHQYSPDGYNYNPKDFMTFEIMSIDYKNAERQVVKKILHGDDDYAKKVKESSGKGGYGEFDVKFIRCQLHWKNYNDDCMTFKDDNQESRDTFYPDD